MDIKSKFCAKCGKEEKKLESGLCADCSFGGSKVSVPATVTLRACKRCGSIEWKGSWVESEFELEYYLEHMLVEGMKLPEQVELKNTELLNNKQVRITVSLLGKEFSQTWPCDTRLKEAVCPECAQKGTQQYLAKVQIRMEDSLGKLDLLMQRYKKRIIKLEEHKTGIDIYFTTKEAAAHFSSEVRQEFRLKMKKTSEVYSWDKSKNRPKTRSVILLKH